MWERSMVKRQSIGVQQRSCLLQWIVAAKAARTREPMRKSSPMPNAHSANAPITPYNPHMRGVHLILRELVDDKDPSVFSRQYALTNAVKCARETGKMYTKVPRVMIHNCAGYLPKEIETLKPDLIITQGQHPAWTVTSSRYFECLKQKEKFMGERGRSAEVWTRENRRCIVLTTPHPARLKGLSWREKKLPEFLLNAIQYSKSLLQFGKSSM